VLDPLVVTQQTQKPSPRCGFPPSSRRYLACRAASKSLVCPSMGCTSVLCALLSARVCALAGSNSFVFFFLLRLRDLCGSPRELCEATTGPLTERH
jgi:hypothetical protein